MRNVGVTVEGDAERGVPDPLCDPVPTLDNEGVEEHVADNVTVADVLAVRLMVPDVPVLVPCDSVGGVGENVRVPVGVCVPVLVLDGWAVGVPVQLRVQDCEECEPVALALADVHVSEGENDGEPVAGDNVEVRVTDSVPP